jgi:hypothetical protein
LADAASLIEVFRASRCQAALAADQGSTGCRSYRITDQATTLYFSLL